MSVQTIRQYEPLTEETAAALVKRLGFFDETADLEVKEIGDGNLNLVFRILDTKSGRSLVVKQALPYAKVVGESWPLTLERARIESAAIKKAGEIVPDLVPHIHYSDDTLAVTVMEDLSSHTIVRKGLIERRKYPKLAEHIGTYLARTLFFTSDLFLHPVAKKELVRNFINPELCKITEDLVFTDPFFDHETNDFPPELRRTVEQLWKDVELKREAAALKYAFLTRAEALVHGDLHTGSIFATEESTKVIDAEFAFIGPIGFDLGQFFANIALNWLSQEHHARDPEERVDFRKYLLGVIEDTWHHFRTQFSDLWKSHSNEVYAGVNGVLERFLATIFTDAVGFAGCEVIRRTIGLAHVADLDSIDDLPLQLKLKERALTLGATLIKKRHEINTIDKLLQLVRRA
jgi:5-methylthioribose kinase